MAFVFFTTFFGAGMVSSFKAAFFFFFLGFY
jgi:hypothetical protein